MLSNINTGGMVKWVFVLNVVLIATKRGSAFIFDIFAAVNGVASCVVSWEFLVTYLSSLPCY